MAKRVVITTDTLGRGDARLGHVLMRNFCYSLARNADKPAAVMLMNEGVRLACSDSEVLDDLRLLVESGVTLKVCGTCLDYLKLTQALQVGEVGTMPEAVAALLGTDEVVTIG
ncbi:MAG: sulfurtransferase-like selenium metabolism protein YedF [Coriobacteriia bacterium]|nr:sulfurtransferase-like selenium metabolism protein YedF [Coriobacteriia bacterium]